MLEWFYTCAVTKYQNFSRILHFRYSLFQFLLVLSNSCELNPTLAIFPILCILTLGSPLATAVATKNTPRRSVGDFGRQAIATHPPTPFLASLRLPALPRTCFGVNGLGMRRATILESGVVIRFEFFELQPFKVDQFFRRFFRDFPTLITLKYIQK